MTLDGYTLRQNWSENLYISIPYYYYVIFIIIIIIIIIIISKRVDAWLTVSYIGLYKKRILQVHIPRIY